MGDRAKVFHQFSVRHPNTGIGKDDRVFLFVRLDGDFQRKIRLVNRLAGTLQKAELFQRIRAIGNQLANENLFIRVEGMNDNIQQLLNLSLKLMFLCAHPSNSLKTKWRIVKGRKKE